MNEAIIAGADIGGSHITVAIIDIGTREILNNSKKRMEINSGREAEDILNSWTEIIRESFDAVNRKPSKIGIAMPGPFDYVNGISYISGQNKFDALYGLNIKVLLAEKLGISVENISFLNDAACFLQGEVFGGAGKGYNRVIGLTLGTGLGSARSLDGETVDANLWCAEFRNGIAEDYLSARWFLKRYKELSGKMVNDVKELVGKANEDFLVQEVFDEFGKNLADFLAPYIKEQQPQLLVLGGNISLAFVYFVRSLKATFDQAHITIEIKTAALGESAALLGAASNHYLFSTTLISQSSLIK